MRGTFVASGQGDPVPRSQWTPSSPCPIGQRPTSLSTTAPMSTERKRDSGDPRKQRPGQDEIDGIYPYAGIVRHRPTGVSHEDRCEARTRDQGRPRHQGRVPSEDGREPDPGHALRVRPQHAGYRADGPRRHSPLVEHCVMTPGHGAASTRAACTVPPKNGKLVAGDDHETRVAIGYDVVADERLEGLAANLALRDRRRARAAGGA